MANCGYDLVLWPFEELRKYLLMILTQFYREKRPQEKNQIKIFILAQYTTR